MKTGLEILIVAVWVPFWLYGCVCAAVLGMEWGKATRRWINARRARRDHAKAMRRYFVMQSYRR